MGFKVVSYTADRMDAVKAFNRRMKDGGWEQGFSESHVPEWLPPGGHPSLYNEFFLAVDDAGAVRGGYILKHQAFKLGGDVVRIANYAFPLSEGVVDLWGDNDSRCGTTSAPAV